MNRGKTHQGFTLLEVMMALAILASSGVAVLGVFANGGQRADYAAQHVRALLLAESKLDSLEQFFPKELLDQAGSGDFEGFPTLRWQLDMEEYPWDYETSYIPYLVRIRVFSADYPDALADVTTVRLVQDE